MGNGRASALAPPLNWFLAPSNLLALRARRAACRGLHCARSAPWLSEPVLTTTTVFAFAGCKLNVLFAVRCLQVNVWFAVRCSHVERVVRRLLNVERFVRMFAFVFGERFVVFAGLVVLTFVRCSQNGVRMRSCFLFI